jgi:hypothetical protein
MVDNPLSHSGSKNHLPFDRVTGKPVDFFYVLHCSTHFFTSHIPNHSPRTEDVRSRMMLSSSLEYRE